MAVQKRQDKQLNGYQSIPLCAVTLSILYTKPDAELAPSHNSVFLKQVYNFTSSASVSLIGCMFASVTLLLCAASQ